MAGLKKRIKTIPIPAVEEKQKVGSWWEPAGWLEGPSSWLVRQCWGEESLQHSGWGWEELGPGADQLGPDQSCTEIKSKDIQELKKMTKVWRQMSEPCKLMSSPILPSQWQQVEWFRKDISDQRTHVYHHIIQCAGFCFLFYSGPVCMLLLARGFCHWTASRKLDRIFSHITIMCISHPLPLTTYTKSNKRHFCLKTYLF